MSTLTGRGVRMMTTEERAERSDKLKKYKEDNVYSFESHPKYIVVYRDTGETVKMITEIELSMNNIVILRKIEVSDTDKYKLLDEQGNEVLFKELEDK